MTMEYFMAVTVIRPGSCGRPRAAHAVRLRQQPGRPARHEPRDAEGGAAAAVVQRGEVIAGRLEVAGLEGQPRLGGETLGLEPADLRVEDRELRAGGRAVAGAASVDVQDAAQHPDVARRQAVVAQAVVAERLVVAANRKPATAARSQKS